VYYQLLLKQDFQGFEHLLHHQILRQLQVNFLVSKRDYHKKILLLLHRQLMKLLKKLKFHHLFLYFH
tara:strand:- start:123 stop:323 length:201 start_codon:yes stop_codon:yes gene_type:complete